MRAIDADELEELFREVIGAIARKKEMNGAMEHMVRASAMVIEMINDAPTIEVKPVKHARLIPVSDPTIGRQYAECSECHCWYPITPYGYVNYCSKCGAKIDNGEKYGEVD